MSSLAGDLSPFMDGSSKASRGLPGAFSGHKPSSISEHRMDRTELQPAKTCLQSFPKLPLWIIEYAWAHNMMEIHQVVDSSNWPEVDSQPLSLEDPWRLRVASAQVYSIVKNRDMQHFERVMGFLEDTYRLLPSLVAPIKHMKIMFGLKTMVIMRLLREGRGMVDTVVKISHFFPSKLPQYQDQCSQREMILMRKNHLDFKALAQALAIDKNKLKDYIKNQMEEQYGERYAQKVEDRLHHYLHQMETVLPGDTYIDKILKKERPVTEEEKLLVEVITSDSTSIATTLKRLLHCEVASCCLGRISQSSGRRKTVMESSQLSKSVLHGSSSQALFTSMEAKTPPQFQPEVFLHGEEADPLLLENDNVSDVSRHQQTEEDGEIVEEDSSGKEKEEINQRSSERVQDAAASSPQFCSKHQRWVKSILLQCPDECSEELQLQANVYSSPPLFQSSSSTTSSQDLTPSDLIPCPPDKPHPPPETSTHLQTTAQAPEQANSEDELSSGSPGSAGDTSQTVLLPQPPPFRDTQLPALLLPVVRLIDIAHVRGIYPTFKPHQAPLNRFPMFSNNKAASTPSPQVLTSPPRHAGSNAIPQGTVEDSMLDQPDTVASTNPPLSQAASDSTSCQPPTPFSKLSRKFRQACATTRHPPALDGFSQNSLAEQFKKAPTTFWTSCPPLPDLTLSGRPTEDASTSQSVTVSSVCAATQIPLATESSQQVLPHNSIKPHTHNISPFESKNVPRSTVLTFTSNSDCPAVRSEISRVLRARLTLSLPSQAALLQSKLLQPHVTLNRLSAQECYKVAKRSITRSVEPLVQGNNDDNDDEEEEDADSSFDLNTLYSSHSSNSGGEDSLHCDPDYKPCIKKKRLLLEYETAGSHI